MECQWGKNDDQKSVHYTDKKHEDQNREALGGQLSEDREGFFPASGFTLK